MTPADRKRILTRLEKLRRLATDRGATPAERASAQRLIDRDTARLAADPGPEPRRRPAPLPSDWREMVGPVLGTIFAAAFDYAIREARVTAAGESAEALERELARIRREAVAFDHAMKR